MVEVWGRRHSEKITGGTRFFWNAEYYTYTLEDEESMIRDDQHAYELVQTLLGKSSEWKNEVPDASDDFRPWFTVAIGISGTRKKKSHYTVDYFKHANCPLKVIDYGMNIYHLVKRNNKRALRKGDAK